MNYDNFHSEHLRMYGYNIPNEIIEFVSFTVTAVGPMRRPELPRLPRIQANALKDERPVYFRGDGWVGTPVYDRELLTPGFSLQGPALIEETMSTTLVHPGDKLTVDDYGNIIEIVS